MSITPKTIQDLIREFEESRQSRFRAWEALQKIRATISDLGHVAIAPPKRKTFEEEGALLDRTVAKCLRDRNEALKSLIKAARMFKEVAMSEDRKANFPSAHQALLKELDRGEDLIQNQERET
jgi:hypothetical protein